jgi:hypothetical protein
MEREPSPSQRAVESLRTVFATWRLLLVVGVALAALAVGKLMLALTDNDDLTGPLIFAAVALGISLGVTWRR